MTNGGRDGTSDTSTRAPRPDTATDWVEGEATSVDAAEEAARSDAERRLRYQLSTQLRDRRRVLTGNDTSLVNAPVTSTRAPVRRPFAVTVYLADGDGHHGVQEAVGDLLEAFDFDVVATFPPLRGSWYRDFIALSRRALTSRELGEQLLKVERGIELQLLHKQQAEIDSMQGDAVAKLLTALEHTPDALVQIGSVLLVKVDGVPSVRNLTQVELRHLEHNPRLLTSPATILDALQAAEQLAAELVDQDS